MSTFNQSKHPAVHKLENIFGYTFRDPQLALLALTLPVENGPPKNPHTSYEALEYLGDRVLNLLVASELYATPALTNFTIIHAQFVHQTSNVKLSRLARKLGLEALLCEPQAGHPPLCGGPLKLFDYKILADVIEAILGAIFRDCDW